MRKSMTWLLAVVMAMTVPATAFCEEEGEGGEEQDFLFLMSEAYTQRQGEWQFGFSAGYFDNLEATEIDEADEDELLDVETNAYQYDLEVEYGITDRLQVEFAIPYLSEEVTTAGDENTEDGIGDIELGIGYALLQEKDGLVALTAGLEVSAPTGDEGKGLGAGSWGWEPYLGISKSFAEKFFVHAQVSYGITNNAEEDGEEVDEREIGYGVAVVYRPVEQIDLIAEFVGERSEEEDSAGVEEDTHTQYLVAGLKYEFENELQLGVGVPVGLNSESFDIGAMVKVQYEFL